MRGFHGKHTQETKDKIRDKLKGRSLPESVRLKISDALKGKMPKFIPNNKGRKHSQEYAERIRILKTGTKASRSTRLKMSLSHQKAWDEGSHVVTNESRQKMIEANRGVNNHNWKGGITPFYFALRGQSLYREWRSAVFKRDNYSCVLCDYKSRGTRPSDIQADHIKPFSVVLYENSIKTLEQAMECVDLWLIENGRTLCIPCHKKTDTYGGKTTFANKGIYEKYL